MASIPTIGSCPIQSANIEGSRWRLKTNAELVEALDRDVPRYMDLSRLSCKNYSRSTHRTLEKRIYQIIKILCLRQRKDLALAHAKPVIFFGC